LRECFYKDISTIMQNTSKLAVIGAGKMGETLIKALIEAKILAAGQIIATAKHAHRVEEVTARLGVPATLDNRAAVSEADVVLLGVKPQALREVLAEIKPVIRGDQLVISIAASATTAFIERHLEKSLPVVRTMPNTPALVGAGMTALCRGAHANDEHLARARQIFDAVGRTVIIDEKYMDAVTALSASGPAYIYVILESLAEGGLKVGLPRQVATELAAQMCLGAAKMVLETGAHPALLKDAVTTPAGCTIDGILQLEEGGLRVTLIKAVVEATRRAAQLIEN
jgi:pyrroline-5-carboxylate reductase